MCDDSELFERLLRSYPKWLKAVLAAGGGPTEYWKWANSNLILGGTRHPASLILGGGEIRPKVVVTAVRLFLSDDVIINQFNLIEYDVTSDRGKVIVFGKL